MEVRCGGGDMSTWTGIIRSSISSFSLLESKCIRDMCMQVLCTCSLNVFMTSINDLGYITMYQLTSTCY